jgi:hypothetical protein
MSRDRRESVGSDEIDEAIDPDAEVIDAALRHAVQSVENLEAVKRGGSPELAERLSTKEVRLTQYPQVRVD